MRPVKTEATLVSEFVTVHVKIVVEHGDLETRSTRTVEIDAKGLIQDRTVKRAVELAVKQIGE